MIYSAADAKSSRERCPFTVRQIWCNEPDCSEETCPIRQQHTRRDNDRIAEATKERWKQEDSGAAEFIGQED